MNEEIARIINKASEYRERSNRYLQNFEWEMEKRDREKAGEALWGVVSCLTNALYLLVNGKPSTQHCVSSNFTREYLISAFGEKVGTELSRIYGKVEKFHANFYHAFLDEEEFGMIAADIMKLIKCLDDLLGDKLDELSKIDAELTAHES